MFSILQKVIFSKFKQCKSNNYCWLSESICATILLTVFELIMFMTQLPPQLSLAEFLPVDANATLLQWFMQNIGPF